MRPKRRMLQPQKWRQRRRKRRRSPARRRKRRPCERKRQALPLIKATAKAMAKAARMVKAKGEVKGGRPRVDWKTSSRAGTFLPMQKP